MINKTSRRREKFSFVLITTREGVVLHQSTIADAKLPTDLPEAIIKAVSTFLELPGESEGIDIRFS